jgi:hypothetical protein
MGKRNQGQIGPEGALNMGARARDASGGAPVTC